VISITRLPEPAQLSANKEKWLAAYLKKRETQPAARPDSRQYGHPGIRNVLEAMSFNKCFYCERKLDETGSQIDHYIEVAQDPTLAFEWRNLYLSCPDCNRKKIPNKTLAVADCLDPCDPVDNPAEHLTFEDEVIVPRPGSSKGSQTIKKYRLDRENLNYLRLRQLQRLYKLLLTLPRPEQRPLTQREKQALASFKQPHHAFSLMFNVYLADFEL
jgi:uncharacterized protein (TIGR02646 family)